MNDTVDKEFSWLDGVDSVEASTTGLDQKAQIMRAEGQEGKDRIWFTDGEYVWFRRAKANPATLERHNNFVASGDYKHVETQDDVEIWQLQPQSPFIGKKTMDISKLSFYDLRRQAALAAVRRDWEAFRDVMMFLRERLQARHGANAAGAETEYAEQYMAVMLSVEQRNGPAPGEINKELFALTQRKGLDKPKLINIGGAR